jgi:hypothetical protein
MTVDLLGEDVVFLAAVVSVAVLDEPQFLEQVEGAVDGRWSCRTVQLFAPGDQLGSRYVALVLPEDLDERATLRRPAQAAGAESNGDVIPGAGGRRAGAGFDLLMWQGAVLSVPSIVAPQPAV